MESRLNGIHKWSGDRVSDETRHNLSCWQQDGILVTTKSEVDDNPDRADSCRYEKIGYKKRRVTRWDRVISLSCRPRLNSIWAGAPVPISQLHRRSDKEDIVGQWPSFVYTRPGVMAPPWHGSCSLALIVAWGICRASPGLSVQKRNTTSVRAGTQVDLQCTFCASIVEEKDSRIRSFWMFLSKTWAISGDQSYVYVNASQILLSSHSC